MVVGIHTCPCVRTVVSYLVKEVRSSFIKPTKFAKRKVRDVTEDDIDDLVRGIIRDFDITAKTFSGFRTIVNGMFKYAKRKKYTSLSISSYLNDLDISRKAFKPTVKSKEK